MVEGQDRKDGTPAANGDGLAGRALGGAAEEFGKEIVPVGKRAGIITAKVCNLLFDKIEDWVDRHPETKERVQEALAKKLDEVPVDKIVAPELRIAVPALQGLALAMDDDQIREMFLNLIAADMNSKTKKSTHPGFAAIIKEITATEARILAILKTDAQIAFLARVKSGRKWRELGRALSFNVPGVDFQTLMRAVSNLDRVGVLEIRHNEHPIGPYYDAALAQIEKDYAPLKASLNQPAAEVAYGIGPNLSLEIRQDGVYLTPFGVAFAKVCLN